MTGLLGPKLGSIIPEMGIKENESVGDVLFSGIQQKVLGLLFRSPDKSFYVNEIRKLGETGRGALQRELRRLTGAGLITEIPVGRQKHYQANKASFLFEELRSIVLKTFGLSGVLAEKLLPLRGSIDCAFIYGSVAKGTDSAASDIDVMVIGDGVTYSAVFSALGDIEQQLGRKVNPTVYSIQEWRERVGRDHHFATRVLQQPKIMIWGNIDDASRGSAEEPDSDGERSGGSPEHGGN